MKQYDFALLFASLPCLHLIVPAFPEKIARKQKGTPSRPSVREMES